MTMRERILQLQRKYEVDPMETQTYIDEFDLLEPLQC